MSIGNLKTEGNKGNNFPWQYKMLLGLQGIIDELQNGTDVTIVAPLGVQPSCADAVSVALCQNQYKRDVTPAILVESGSNGGIPISIYSISFASNGTADALISFDGGVTYVALPAGTTVNMDAAGLANTYPIDLFYWDTTTNVGSSLIITYNY
jgi:acyl CoA:acetate/3-ketoacid CoA transferase